MADAPTTLDGNIGRVIAEKYRIVSVLGSGGAGTVYRAMQVGLERPVALKVLNQDVVANPTARARFRREARAASRLDHPNSVRVFDYGIESDGTTYLAMELIDGRELFKVIYEDWPHSTERIASIIGQVLAVLSTAHELGIVHRDLKPENILLQSRTSGDGTRSETVKVTDFGIAKTFAEMGEESMKLTQAGTVHGTPEYMAPEQARGEEVDGRVDLYAVGVIMYEMMTGSLPFTSDNAFEVLIQQMGKAVEPPTKRRASADRRLEPIVMKALAKVREDRYATANAMHEALSEAARAPAFPESDPTLEDRPTLDARAFAPTINKSTEVSAEPQDAPIPLKVVTQPGAAKVAPYVRTEVVPVAGNDEPVDAASIGVGRRPIAIIALVIAMLGAGVFAIGRFMFQTVTAPHIDPVLSTATDAQDANDATNAAPDVVTAVDAAADVHRTTTPPRRPRRRPR